MPASSSVPTRKRSRAQLAEEDLDELSPQKGGTTTPLSGGQKKRKLNTHASSPAVGAISSFGRTISGFLGFGGRKGKENVQDAEEEDELATEKDIFEIEVSEPEDSEQTKTNGRSSKTGSQRRSERQRSDVVSPIQKSSTKKKATADEPEIDIYEVTVSDEEDRTGSIGRRGRDKIERTKSILKEKRMPGRPRKSDILKKDKALSREAARRRITAEEEAPVDEEPEVETPKRRKSNRTEENSPDDVDSQLEAPPSTSKRGRPRKESVENLNSTEAPPKGILTPSKHRTGKSRKSVAFEREDTEVDLGFKDLPDTASSRKAKGNGARAPIVDSAEDLQEAQEAGDDASEVETDEEQEEAACSICSKLTSRKGNQILFCDGCDKAVHQKCYEVPVIPEGDWFCRDCKPDAEDESELEVNGELTGIEPSGDLPDIEGFENHLRITQRILLGKLTGQRRMKLSGQDEQMQKVHQVVEQTVLAGEGNSMLVIGGRGCGKTTVSWSPILFPNANCL
jgi:origin recognition complex subunit 4